MLEGNGKDLEYHLLWLQNTVNSGKLVKGKLWDQFEFVEKEWRTPSLGLWTVSA